MNSYQIPYGKHQIDFRLPRSHLVDWIMPPEVQGVVNPENTVRNALRNPIGEVNYENFTGATSVAIAINDKTRPVPLAYLIPPLLEKLSNLQIDSSAMTFYIATGTHEPVKPEEYPEFLPEFIYSRFTVVSHDCDLSSNLVNLGRTSFGTPVLVNKQFFYSDIKIVTGNIEPHHFMGFSGGVKTAAIGLTGRETITRNHAMLPNPHCDLGVIDENPMRQDIEEIGKLIGIDLCLNAVPNTHKEIVSVLCGDPMSVIKAGVFQTREIASVANDYSYDLIIASAGGFPKDINLYQAQKAITHAAKFAHPGSVLIMALECAQGSGSAPFENFMTGLFTYDQVLEKFQHDGFQIGPHKAFQLARQTANQKIFLLSSLPKKLVEIFLLTPITTIEEGVNKAYEYLPTKPKIGIMPYAPNTLPSKTDWR